MISLSLSLSPSLKRTQTTKRLINTMLHPSSTGCSLETWDLALAVFLDLRLPDPVREVPERLELVPLLLVHGEDGGEGGLEVLVLHLGHEGPGGAGEDGGAAEPDLVGVHAVPYEGELGHVGAGAAVGAACHAHHYFLLVDVEGGEDGADALDVRGHAALGLGLGKAAEGEGGAGHGEAGEGVDLLDGLDAVLGEDGVDSCDVGGGDVGDYDALGGGHDHGPHVLVGDGAEGRLEAEVPLVLHAAVVDVNSEEHVAVSLLPPAHPVGVLERLLLLPGLDLLPEVALHELLEVLNSQSVHEVLHPRVGPDVPVAVVALGGEDALHELHHVVLGDEAEVVGGAGEGVLLVVGAAHASSYHYVEA
mmetsp:Transcript_13395/g.24627  ORF Transcript_13395/g.24627 Transcript_13395/m.24627 type:complete len:362 (-) Transcript_13395:987-2072(-)